MPAVPAVHVRTKPGPQGVRELEVHVAEVACEHTRGAHVIVIARDTTDRRQIEDRLRFLSLHDALTGLPNRDLFRERLEQAMARARRGRTKAAVLILDLDRFKHINDTFGHGAGDTLLQQVAGRLQSALREVDTVARLGGDEFAVILTDVRSVPDVEAVTRSLLNAISAPFRVAGEALRVTASVGIAVFPDDAASPDDLTRSADAAMYQAKSGGKNGYRFYTEDMNRALATRLALVNGMERGLERGEFVLHYQPQVALETGRAFAVEALVRWQHPKLGLIGPGRFIPLAEESGFIGSLGRHVLRQACAQLAAWRADGLGDALGVAVNVSGRQFHRGDIVEAVRRALDEAALDPAALTVEVTESAVIEDIDAAVRLLRELSRLGVRVALDDFGTGHASLAYLSRLPFQQLKIDRQFVAAMDGGGHGTAIANAIVNMARALGLAVVAEGVETEAQLRQLRTLGCDGVQGYHLARPMPAEACTRYLRDRPPQPAPCPPGGRYEVAASRQRCCERPTAPDHRPARHPAALLFFDEPW
jgi:diguanylate cyclase (GGDEF)-like protein